MAYPMTSSPDDGSSQWYIHWLLWRTFKPEHAVELSIRLSTERKASLKKQQLAFLKEVNRLITKYS